MTFSHKLRNTLHNKILYNIQIIVVTIYERDREKEQKNWATFIFNFIINNNVSSN